MNKVKKILKSAVLIAGLPTQSTAKRVFVFKNVLYLNNMLAKHRVLLLYVIMSTGNPDIKTYPWFSLKPIL